MNKTKSKIIVTAILFVMLSSVLSFAIPTVFTDVEGHWAKEYIEDTYERKLITGYPDGTFKPQGNITKLETIVLIAKLMGYTDSEGQYYINQYKQQLKDNNIPEWGQGTMAYALFNEILPEEDLKSFVSSSSQTYAKRYEVAVYIGKVLQYGAGEEIDKINVIPYKDEMSIPDMAKPYIELLLNKEILDKASNEGRFLPNNEITRAEVAKLVSLSAKILDDVSDDDIIVEPETPPPVISVRRTINGYIDNIILGAKNIISIESGGNGQIYEIDPEASVSVNGEIANVRQLEIGQPITAIIEDDIVIDIKAISSKNALQGYFHYYLPGQSPNIFIIDSKDIIHEFLFTGNSSIRLSGKLVDIKDINGGDMVTVFYDDNEIIRMEAEPKEKYFKGVVRAKNDNKDKYSLEVLLDDNVIETFTFTSEADLFRERKLANFEDIKIGDEVEIITEYDVVVYVNAYGMKRIAEGYIKRIVIGQKTEPTEITIEKYDGTTETFELSPDTIIRVEEKRAGIYDLRLNYEVELEIENDEVLRVETYRKLQGSNYSGKVTYLNSRREVLELQIGNRDEIEIYVNSDTIYNDEKGNLVKFKDIYVGDEVVVVTEDNGYYVTAKRVIVIIRR